MMPAASVARLARPRRRRAIMATSLIAAAAVMTTLISLRLGDYPLSITEVLAALFTLDGGFATTIVLEWRLPRVTVALAFGAALAVAGALFQSLTRNPLGSPDIIGFSTGSYTGALLVITVLGETYLSTAAGALAGGLLTALVVYALAYRRSVQGFRLIVVGIAVTAMLHSLNTWLLLNSATEVAMTASIWGAGSITLVTWSQAWPAMATLAATIPVVCVLHPAMRQLELGDETARGHGVPVERTRLGLVMIGVTLTAVVTAAAGPIAFIALSAPHIAKRLTNSAGLPLIASAVTGAFLLALADLVAQHALPGAIPVGGVTVIIGGAYLLTLLIRQSRSG